MLAWRPVHDEVRFARLSADTDVVGISIDSEILRAMRCHRRAYLFVDRPLAGLISTLPETSAEWRKERVERLCKRGMMEEGSQAGPTGDKDNCPRSREESLGARNGEVEVRGEKPDVLQATT